LDIKYLKNHEINLIRWDNCINNSINSNIFAFSWYLNIICENWAALVSGDYEYVMPIIQVEKFKHKIIFNSKLSNRLGIFSNNVLSENISSEFIKSIPKSFSNINLLLNKFNKLSGEKTKKHSTFELDLMQSYVKLYTNFSLKFQANIELAVQNKTTIIRGLLPNELFRFILKNKVYSNPKLSKNELLKLKMILAHGLRYNLTEIYGAYTAENNLCAVALFIKSQYKIHLLFNSINDYGLKTNAMHLLISNFIKTHSEKNLTLNLENIITINDIDYLTGVGAHAYKYTGFYMSKLPFIFKLLIKYF